MTVLIILSIMTFLVVAFGIIEKDVDILATGALIACLALFYVAFGII
ncbi:hypothetical protein PALS2_062 [Staphylococcus phage PALS_2]|nr:hypothetical protein PALS2_062 [Staphylococcus phage PALS_2]BDE75731.1 hypothetical protein [Staphylococcus phage S6]